MPKYDYYDPEQLERVQKALLDKVTSPTAYDSLSKLFKRELADVKSRSRAAKRAQHEQQDAYSELPHKLPSSDSNNYPRSSADGSTERGSGKSAQSSIHPDRPSSSAALDQSDRPADTALAAVPTPMTDLTSGSAQLQPNTQTMVASTAGKEKWLPMLHMLDSNTKPNSIVWPCLLRRVVERISTPIPDGGLSDEEFVQEIISGFPLSVRTADAAELKSQIDVPEMNQLILIEFNFSAAIGVQNVKHATLMRRTSESRLQALSDTLPWNYVLDPQYGDFAYGTDEIKDVFFDDVLHRCIMVCDPILQQVAIPKQLDILGPRFLGSVNMIYMRRRDSAPSMLEDQEVAAISRIQLALVDNPRPGPEQIQHPSKRFIIVTGFTFDRKHKRAVYIIWPDRQRERWMYHARFLNTYGQHNHGVGYLVYTYNSQIPLEGDTTTGLSHKKYSRAENLIWANKFVDDYFTAQQRAREKGGRSVAGNFESLTICDVNLLARQQKWEAFDAYW